LTALAGSFCTQDPRIRQMLDHCRNFIFSTASQEILSNDM
jgi:hypothetical protein